MTVRAARMPKPVWPAIAAIVAAGLLLRIAAAGGGLWTDEAWSMIYAEQARTPLGVFLRINHDNNHHLYSLWLQAIGPGAAPLLARAPAIVAGTVTILVAALIGARRSPATAIVAAGLFAIAPILVTYGSEARGYAPMLLAAMLMLLQLDRWLDGDLPKPPAAMLAILAALGTLSHLTMIAPVALLAVWVYSVRRSADGPDAAIRSTAAAVGPALAAAALVVLMVVAAAALSDGMKLGGYTRFDFEHFLLGVGDLAASTLGGSLGPSWVAPGLLGAAACAIAIRPPHWLGPRRRLYPLLILAVPLAVAVVRPGNPQFARYYLASALGLLLLASEWIAREMRASGGRRWLSVAVLAALVGGGLWSDSELIRLRRGDPDRALRTIAALAPAGATVAFAEERLSGVMIVAARRSGYRLKPAQGCEPAGFLIAARPSARAPEPVVVRCGTPMRLVAHGDAAALSGDSWSLYAPERLQWRRAAGSGPPPGAGNGAFPAERA